MQYDAIVVGSGFSGAVCARVLAENHGKRVLLMEKRPHIGGNMYDEPDEHGILVHRYGPHIFHTALSEAYDFLSAFTRWRPYEHRVLGRIDGHYVPIPFNFTSMDILFPEAKSKAYQTALAEAFPGRSKASVLDLMESDNPEVRELGAFVFEKVFKNYTAKQWGTSPDKLDRSVIGRVPVVLSRDDRYFDDPYQAMPAEGYTPVFEKLLDHPGITVQLNCDAVTRLTPDTKAGCMLFDNVVFHGPVVYTGPLDELFGFCFGELPYRSLDMVFEHKETECFQPASVVNYPNEEAFTRITEFKYLTGQTASSTTIMKEYPLPCDRHAPRGNIPYYPIPDDESRDAYARYQKEASSIRSLFLCGRLAEYRYYNMDAAVVQALRTAEAAAHA